MHFLVTFDHTIRGKKELELYLAGKCWSWTLLILTGPFISRKKNCSDYRLHGTQNDRLILTVSTHKSVLKNMPWVPRYLPKCAKIQVAKPNLHIFRRFGQYLQTPCIFFKTDLYVETVSPSRSF